MCRIRVSEQIPIRPVVSAAIGVGLGFGAHNEERLKYGPN
jgi:hypothetical protein